MRKGFLNILLSAIFITVLVLLTSYLLYLKNHSTKPRTVQIENPKSSGTEQPLQSDLPINLNGDNKVLMLSNPTNHKIKIYEEENFVTECARDSNFSISADKKSILYTKNNNIFLITDNCKEETQITYDGQKGTNKFYPANAIPVGFSPDGKKFLYALENEICLGDCTQIFEVNPLVKEGLYLFDINSKKSIFLTDKEPFFNSGYLAPYYIGWTNESKYPVFESDRIRAGDFYVFNLDTLEASLLDKKSTDFGWGMQTEIEGNKFMLWGGAVYPNNQENGLSTIRLSKWDKSKEINISPLGSFAEYQWPSLSPDGKKVKYLHQFQDYNDKPGNPHNELEVFDLSTQKTLDLGRVEVDTHWYGPNTILMTKGKNVYSLDINTKESGLFSENSNLLGRQ